MAARTAKLKWIRAPLQTRSQETLERILDATEVLLEEKTFEEISVSEIVRKARSSVGSFYARFVDKDSLLLHLQQRLYTESRLTAQEALAPQVWEGTPLELLIPSVVTFMCETYQERLGLRRALQARMVSDERFRTPATTLSKEVCRLLVELVSSRREEVQHENIPLAVDVCHRIVFSTLDQHYTFSGAPTGRRLAPKTLGRELSAACIAYLGVRP